MKNGTVISQVLSKNECTHTCWNGKKFDISACEWKENWVACDRKKNKKWAPDEHATEVMTVDRFDHWCGLGLLGDCVHYTQAGISNCNHVQWDYETFDDEHPCEFWSILLKKFNFFTLVKKWLMERERLGAL